MEHLSIIKSLSIHIFIQFNITVHQNSFIKLCLKVLVIDILVLDFTSISIKKFNVDTVSVPLINSLTIYTKYVLFKLSDSFTHNFTFESLLSLIDDREDLLNYIVIK